MSKLIKYFLELILVGILSVQLVTAIQCYNCDSIATKDCNSISDTSSVKPVECRPNVLKENTPEWLNGIINIDYFETTSGVTVPMVCQKIIAKNEKGDDLTYRGCQIDGGKSNVCEVSKSKAKLVENGIEIVTCELCSEDACNKSAQTFFDIRLVVVLLAIVKFIY